MIVSLSDERNLKKETQFQIDIVAEKLSALTTKFQSENYPPEKSREEQENRKKLLEKQTDWGATGMEIPPYPETKRGEKFESASLEMNVIVEEFFQIKNDNQKFQNISSNLKNELKEFKNSLKESQNLEKDYLRKISKISGRISRSNIFPSKSLNSIEKAVKKFDKVQKAEQGNLRTIDTFLFPAGTIVASGETCSEQGTGRWLPKPTDTLKIFLDLLKPSVGYKNFPMLWYQFIGFNEIIDFLVPDWIADLLPGEYPVHSSNGEIEPNLKKHVLNFVSG